MSTHTQPSPAAEVFRRFIGMFGADAVARKYGQGVPDEWKAMLMRLNEHQVQRGVRMLAYSGKSHVPSLPEFVKLCRDAEHDREVNDQTALPNPDAWQGDEWGSAANHHLLAYITREVSRNPERYGKGRPTYEAMQKKRKPGDGNADASPEFVACVQVLVGYKNGWAQDMREEAVAGAVPVERQKAYWADCMRRAEEQITQLRESYAEAVTA